MRIVICLLVSLLCFSSLFAEWTIVASYEIHSNASGLAWDGTWLYAGVYGANGGNIYRIDPSDGSSTLLFTGPQEDSYGLTWDGAALWCTDHDVPTADPANAYQIDLSGSLLQQFPLTDHYMSGIAYDDGDFWVATYYDPDGHIYKVDDTGAVITSFAAPDNQPWDLCLQGEDLWMADYWGDTIYRLDTSNGSVIESHASESVDPSGVVYDGQYLWYIDNGTGGNDWLYKVDLGGEGVISTSADSLDYGVVRVGSQTMEPFFISNQGNGNLTISQIEIDNDNWSCSLELPHTFSSQDTLDLRVWFQPTVAGVQTGAMTLHSNDPETPQAVVTLQGEAEIVSDELGTEYWRIINTEPTCVIPFHDLTGDGVCEIIAGDPYYMRCYNGNSSGEADVIWKTPYTGDFIGTKGAVIDDANGDGVPEFVYNAATSYEIVQANGATGETIWTAAYTSEGYASNTQLVATQDHTGDGYPDVIISQSFVVPSLLTRSLYCFNGMTGQQIWSFQSERPVYLCRSVDDITGDNIPDVVTLNRRDASQNCQLALHDGASGAIVWTLDATDETASDIEILDDINGDGSPDIVFCSGDLDLFAVDHLGNILWTWEDDYGQGALSVIDWNGVQYLLKESGVLLNPTDGSVIWESSYHSVSPTDDLNGDGVFDVLSEGHVVLSGVDGSFIESFVPGNPHDGCLRFCDVDSNGADEIVMHSDPAYIVFCVSGGTDGADEPLSVGIQVGLVNGESPLGASVSLTNRSTGEILSGVAPASGIVAFNGVPQDVYCLVTTLDGYQEYRNETELGGDCTINVNLIETFAPVTNLTAEVSADSVTLSWDYGGVSRCLSGVRILCDGETIETLWIEGSPYVIENHPAGSFIYGVAAVYGSGESIVEEVSVTAAEDNVPPLVTALHGAQPNPFNPRTVFACSLAKPGVAELRIFNVRGQLVRTISAGRLEAGEHSFVWNGAHDDGIPAATGVYFARLMVDNSTVDSKRCLLLK